MSNAMDGNGILVFLDRDLKAPQPALTKTKSTGAKENRGMVLKCDI